MPPAWERSAANTSGCTIRLQVNRRPTIRTSPRVVRFCENGLASHRRFSRATNRIAVSSDMACEPTTSPPSSLHREALGQPSASCCASRSGVTSSMNSSGTMTVFGRSRSSLVRSASAADASAASVALAEPDSRLILLTSPSRRAAHASAAVRASDSGIASSTRRLASQCRAARAMRLSAAVFRSPERATVSIDREIGPIRFLSRATLTKGCAASEIEDQADPANRARGCWP